MPLVDQVLGLGVDAARGVTFEGVHGDVGSERDSRSAPEAAPEILRLWATNVCSTPSNLTLIEIAVLGSLHRDHGPHRMRQNRRQAEEFAAMQETR